MTNANDRESPPPAAAVSTTHPRGLWVLFITEMWERFSYYGMRALLMFYLIASTSAVLPDGDENTNPGFGWAKADASVLYGLYTGAVYLTPLIGGWLADRFLGTHRSMLIGGWIIAAGHITLAVTELFGVTAGKAVTMQTGPGAFLCFMTGLVLIVVGTGFFKPCVSVMVGQLYEQGDPRRDSGFTIFYMGINLGAFFSPLVAGTLGEKIGWHWGFGSAAVGMITGLFFYQIFRSKYLGNIGLPPTRDENLDLLSEERKRELAEATRPLNSVDWQRLAVILILAFVGNIFFWAAFEQAGTSLNVFALEQTDRSLWGLFEEGGWLAGLFDDASFPASWYQSVNPLAILLFAPFFSWLWIWLTRRRLNPSTPMKFAWGLYLLGLGFLAMVAGSFRAQGGHLAGPQWLLLTYLVCTWGELCLSPVGLSMVTKLAPKRLQSLMMGVWFLSFALSNTLAGLVAAFSTQMDTSVHVVALAPADGRPVGPASKRRSRLLFVDKNEAKLFADVKIDARSRELTVLLLKNDKTSPLPVGNKSIRFDADVAPEGRPASHVRLTLKPRPQKKEKKGKSSRFVIPLDALPEGTNDIEQISGKLRLTVDSRELQPPLVKEHYQFDYSGELVHEHYTFVFDGLPGFFLMLVLFPMGAGVLITLLSPLLKRMMHGIE
jgi:proton-dependent oligopeptide transporter, POT family